MISASVPFVTSSSRSPSRQGVSSMLSTWFLSIAILAFNVCALPFQSRSVPFPISSHSTRLVRSRSSIQHSSAALHNKLGGTSSSNITSELAGQAFYANVFIGQHSFNLILDTGSSDTWVVETGFQCQNISTYDNAAEADCGFASTYTRGKDFTQIPDENFYIAYADDSYGQGIVGYDKVTIANITVAKQEIGLVNETAWLGDNQTSGLIGLAYPVLTSAYNGTDPDEDYPFDNTSNFVYSPLMNTIFNVEKLAQPIFSMALSRNPATKGYGGLLTIGGIPDTTLPTVNSSSKFTTVPIQKTPDLLDDPVYAWYLINASFAIGKSHNQAPNTQVIIDSGTTLNYIPTHEAAAINAMFDPPSFPDDQDGFYYVDCNATSPTTLGVTIAGTTFYLNPADLISRDASEESDDEYDVPSQCVSAFQDGGLVSETYPGSYILGDPFMNNVLVVFDWGKEEISFASRVEYDVPQ